MAPTLYMVPPSPAVRAVLMTARAIGLDLVQKEVDMGAREHLKPEFIKLNPQHTIPTLVDDDGFVIWDSHAIITYLVSKYGKGGSLYPDDIKTRAIIDQRLFFELGFVFSRLLKIADPVIKGDKENLTQEDRESIDEVYTFLEAFLEGRTWMAADSVTVADYSIVSSVSSLNILHPIEDQRFPKLGTWFKKCESLPEYEANKKGLEIFANVIRSKLVCWQSPTMAPTLYMFHESPPSRAVLMAAKAIGLDVKIEEIDYLAGDNTRPDILKMNPQHTVPILVDNGFVLSDSHAIMTYLVSKYAKSDSLYPKDLQKRAIVDQRLYFDAGIAFPRLLRITRPILFHGRKGIDQQDRDNMVEAYSFLESFLSDNKFVAGDFVTIADYSLVATFSSIATLVPIDGYPKVTAWMKRVEQLPEYEANRKGLETFPKMFKGKLPNT